MKKLLLFLLSWSLVAQAAIQQKVIICGVCRDVAERVPYSMKIMEKIGALFADYRIVVYENNSSDQTPALLRKFQKRNNKILVVSENLTRAYQENTFINRVDNNQIYRPEAISRARNIVLGHAMSDAYQGFDYVIWMDMDFKIEPNYDGFKEVFLRKGSWDAVFAYGTDPRGEYWDWYALRDNLIPIGSELLGQEWWFLPKELKLKKSDDWYPVTSAFGGCGIYRKEAIKGCRYSALVTQDLAEVAHKIIYETHTMHRYIQQYLTNLKNITQLVTINNMSPQLPEIKDPLAGVVVDNLPPGIVWRMSSFTYKYPSVCEHATFHASMIVRGYDKLFINPRLMFHYGG